MLSFTPTVAPTETLAENQLREIRKNLKQLNPFKHQGTGNKQITIDEAILNQTLNYAASNFINLSFAAFLHEKTARVNISLSKPFLPQGLYLNISAKLIESEPFIKVSDVRAGRVPIPDFVVEKLLKFGITYLIKRYPDHVNLVEQIKQVQMRPQKLTIEYFWDNRIAKQIQNMGRDVLLSPTEQERLSAYYQKLSQLSMLYFWRKTALHEVLRPIFELAQSRSMNNNDPIAENKSALLALGLVATGLRVTQLLPESSKKLRPPHFYRLHLRDRRDLMQHFLISAALAVSSNQALSDNIGLAKEMDDSHGGSGFSFADLLADRAGVKLAMYATRDKATAIKVQFLLANPKLTEDDFMPAYDQLPENISALEFQKEYVDVNNEKYLFVERALQDRLAKCGIYQ